VSSRVCVRFLALPSGLVPGSGPKPVQKYYLRYPRYVQGSFCSSCGAPNGPGSQFCAYCGRPIAPSPAPPPTGANAALPPTVGGGYPTPYPPPSAPGPRRSSRLVLVAVVIVVTLLVVSGVAIFLLLTPPPLPVQVGQINIYSPDNVCGLNSTFTAFTGFNSTTSANETFEFPMPNDNSSACTIQSVSTNTTGFSVPEAQVPITIPPSPAFVWMNITIVSPNSSFSGTLYLELQ
jgi:hypothetical protein